MEPRLPVFLTGGGCGLRPHHPGHTTLNVPGLLRLGGLWTLHFRSHPVCGPHPDLGGTKRVDPVPFVSGIPVATGPFPTKQLLCPEDPVG